VLENANVYLAPIFINLAKGFSVFIKDVECSIQSSLPFFQSTVVVQYCSLQEMVRVTLNFSGALIM
jgi:hypothetical protein